MASRGLALVITAVLLAGSINQATAAAAQPAVAVSDSATRLREAVQLDPARGERLAALEEQRALSAPSSPQRDEALLTARYFRAEAMMALNRTADAAPIIGLALQQMPRSLNASKLHGRLLMTRSGVASGQGRASAAIADLHAAYEIFAKLREPRLQAVALVGIGAIYADGGFDERALYYYRLADEAYPGDDLLSLSSKNNQANALNRLRRFGEAKQNFQEALEFATKLKSPVLQARILNNIAYLQMDTGDLAGAARSLDAGLEIARPGSDAADWRPLLLAGAARLAFTNGQIAKAVDLIGQAKAGRTPAQLRDLSYRELHKIAYDVYRAAGDAPRALSAYEIYRQIDDESRSLVTQASAALLAARFDFANQNARISTLKAGQLQRDVALAEARTRQNAIVLGSLLAIAVIVAVLLGLYLRVLARSRRAAEQANVELSRVNTELQHALAAKSRFLATTSHEIRTPLNGVLGMTQVLLSDGAVQGDVRERVGLVHQAGETMRALVDDILEFAKIDAGSIDVAKSAFDVHKLLEDVVRFWRPQAMRKGLTLTLERGIVPQMIVDDERRLRQILFNLLSNALKFTSEGGIAVVASIVPGEADRLVIAISDTGIGIPEHGFETIFETFHQLDSSTTRTFGGTGLGLSISRSLARALGGDLTVQSRLGEGSTFTLDLPLQPAAIVEKAAATATQAAGELAQASVMLVGGARLAQSVLAGLLRPVVANVRAVANSAAALDDPDWSSLDIVVVDGATEDAAALDSLARARTNDRRPRVVVLVSNDSPTVDAGLLDPADQRVPRPVTAPVLLAAVEAVLTAETIAGRETSHA